MFSEKLRQKQKIVGCRSHVPTLMMGLGALGLLALSTPEALARRVVSSQVDRLPGQMVVQLKKSSGVEIFSIVESLNKILGEKAILDIHPLETDRQTFVVRLANDGDLPRALQTLKNQAKVQWAEPNSLYHTFDDGLPNDPLLEKTWGLLNHGQADSSGQTGKVGSDVRVAQLWQEGITGSQKVVVAVIDTGIDWDHADLKNNLYTNPAESGLAGANLVDDDQNGFVDDIHGWNFAGHNNNSRDDQKHGSHCSGTIGATGNNGEGVTGINWLVSLMPVKFLDAQGSGSLADAVDSINYATLMKVNVMSNSWGGGALSEIMKQAVEKARDAGILFVAAAGNDTSDNDARPSYPASLEVANVISVAATDNRDQLARFSNYGKNSVHVAAPGVKIMSTVVGGGYAALSGTSMAAPHVSGIAALMLSALPDLTYQEIKDRLIKTSEPVVGLKRKVLAKGRVSAYNAIHNIVPPVDEPAAGEWKSEAVLIQSDHPYLDGIKQDFVVSHPGAKRMRVHFEKIAVESNYDFVTLRNGTTNEAADRFTGTSKDVTTDEVNGDRIIVRLLSDESNSGYGFRIDRIEYLE